MDPRGLWRGHRNNESWDSCRASRPHSCPHQFLLVGSPSPPSQLRKLPWSCALLGLGGQFFKQLPWLVAVVVGGAAGTEQLPSSPHLPLLEISRFPSFCSWKEFCATWFLCCPRAGTWEVGKRGEQRRPPTQPGSTHALPPTLSGLQAAGCPFPRLAQLRLHSWHSGRLRPSPSSWGRGRARWGRGMGHTQSALGAFARLSLDLHVLFGSQPVAWGLSVHQRTPHRHPCSPNLVGQP